MVWSTAADCKTVGTTEVVTVIGVTELDVVIDALDFMKGYSVLFPKQATYSGSHELRFTFKIGT